MSAYQDIYLDLPSRVSEVWKRTKTHPDNESKDLSATAMLMAAAAGLAMPWESLKDVGIGNGSDWNAHPSFANGNQKHYQAVLKSCSAFLAQKISDTESLKTISFQHCQNQIEIRDVAEYGQSGKTQKHTVRCAVRVIRNALAHNNIVAFGPNPEQIEKIGFFSENRIGSGCVSTIHGYLVLTITTESFAAFLDAWFLSLLPTKS